MITLSEFLDTIPFPDNAYSSVQMAIREAKRLEALGVPRVNAERTPLKGPEGNPRYIVVDENSLLSSAYYMEHGNAERSAATLTKTTGRPHTVCQVMAPESGKCPTVPVVTYTPTPEKPHEWVICCGTCEYRGRWYATHRRGDGYWAYDLPSKEIRRFATAHEAQAYIDSNKLRDAYPWPVPKLTTAS